jgi:hypothetical protein
MKRVGKVLPTYGIRRVSGFAVGREYLPAAVLHKCTALSPSP